MKIKLKASSKVILEAEGDTHVDLFTDIASMQEVFSEEQCGCCNSSNIRFVARQNADEDWFYEMKCREIKCRATLQFGSRKKPKGSLYPKRRWDALSPGEKTSRADQEELCKSGYLPNNGWWKYVKKTE